MVFIVDAGPRAEQPLNLTVVSSFEGVTGEIDGAVVTDLSNAAAAYSAAVAALGKHRVLSPTVVSIVQDRVDEVAE